MDKRKDWQKSFAGKNKVGENFFLPTLFTAIFNLYSPVSISVF